jgi:hypothetical protein
MRINRVPSGHLDVLEDRIVISGDPPSVILRSAVRSAEVRSGKPSLFSRDPPAVFELEYSVAIGTNAVKLLIPKDSKAELERILATWRR